MAINRSLIWWGGIVQRPRSEHHRRELRTMMEVFPLRDGGGIGLSLTHGRQCVPASFAFNGTYAAHTGGARPLAPSGSQAKPVSAGCVSWTASLGATSYNVKRSTTNGGPYTNVGCHRGTFSQHPGLTDGYNIFSMWFLLETRRRESTQAQVFATAAVLPAACSHHHHRSNQTHPISPWIYGINSFAAFPILAHLRSNRLGAILGQPTTAENNASNAGSDFRSAQ